MQESIARKSSVENACPGLPQYWPPTENVGVIVAARMPPTFAHPKTRNPQLTCQGHPPGSSKTLFASLDFLSCYLAY